MSSKLFLRFGLVLSIFAGFPNAPAAGGWLGIFGRDDRDATHYNDGWPWVAIGRLDLRAGGHCSGTLIERNLVLTAAHCLSDNRGGLIDPTELTFSAGYKGGLSRARAGVQKIHMHPDFRFDGRGHPEVLALDWAVLELDRQLYDGGWLRPVPLAPALRVRRAIAEQPELAQAGYSGDRDKDLTRNRRCTADGLADNGAILLHHCDATFGDSGSPILMDTEDGYMIAGIHVAIVTIDGVRYGAAVIPDVFD